MGDQLFFDKVLQAHNVLIRETLSKHNGRELKTIGEPFSALSRSRPRPSLALVRFNNGCRHHPSKRKSVRSRFGLARTGTPKVYRDSVSKRIDLSGTDVDKAARVEGLARGEHVLISDETRASAKPKEYHDWGMWALKGLGRHRVFEVLWPGKTAERPAGHAWLEPVRYLTRFYGRELT